MQISVKDVPSEILVNTVILSHNYRNPTNVDFFRCYRCGTGLSQIQGKINAIYAGYVPSDSVAVITRCYKCAKDNQEINYTFQTGDDLARSKTKLILATTTNVNTFHCIICRMPLIQYNGKGAVLLPDFQIIHMPRSFACFNNTCTTQYLLTDIVEPVLVV